MSKRKIWQTLELCLSRPSHLKIKELNLKPIEVLWAWGASLFVKAPLFPLMAHTPWLLKSLLLTDYSLKMIWQSSFITFELMFISACKVSCCTFPNSHLTLWWFRSKSHCLAEMRLQPRHRGSLPHLCIWMDQCEMSWENILHRGDGEILFAITLPRQIPGSHHGRTIT